MTGDGVGIESVPREVAENSPAGTYVGAPLPEATDEDGSPITYTLKDVMDGDDAKFFALRATVDGRWRHAWYYSSARGGGADRR